MVNEETIPKENTGTLKEETSQIEESTIKHTSEDTKLEDEPEKEPKTEAPKPVEYLTLTGEYSSIDESAYTSDEIALISTILAKINENVSKPDIHEEKIPLYASFTLENYSKVASYFYVYYGTVRAVDYTFDLVNSTREDGYLRLRYDNIREFETEMNQNRIKIDSILSGFTTGSEEHILIQIAEYLKNNIVYTDGYYDLSCALNGRSVCNGYALAFNAMANRAGIKSDMCIGEAGNGLYHAWNRVTLNDGSYYFYDITFYDSTENPKYLHSTTSFYESYLINDYTSCWLKY